MRNCTELTPRLYFELDALLSDSVSEGGTNYNNILNLFKEKVVTYLGLDKITDLELKNFITASSQSLDMINKILNSGSTSEKEIVLSPEEVSSSNRTAEEVYSEHNSDDESPAESVDEPVYQVGLAKINLTENVYNGKLISSNDLYDNYFKGSMLGYNFFRNNFSNKLFSASFVSFEKGFIVETQEQLNDNIQDFRNSLINDLMNYLEIPKEILNDPKSLRTYIDKEFQQRSISNFSLNQAIQNNPDDKLLKAYFAYIGIKHFDDLIKMFSVNVSINKSLNGVYSGNLKNKYSVKLKHHQKNNFSDSFVNMLDEITSLTRTMIDYTPLIGIDGKLKNGQYLNSAAVNSLASKLKDQKVTFGDSINLRLNPQLKIKELLKYIILNPSKARECGFNKADLDVAITVYNYFYKTDEDHSIKALDKKLNKNIHSLVSIKSKSFANKKYISSNLVVNAITCQMDKTIAQKYVSLKETHEGLQKIYTQMESIDKHFARTKSNLNTQSNQIDDNLTDTFEFIKKKENYTGLVSFSIGNMNFNLMNAVQTDIANVDYKFEHLTAEEWAKYMNADSKTLPLNEAKQNFAQLVDYASTFTGLNLSSANGELILAMADMDANEIANNLVDIITKMAYARNIKKLHRDQNPKNLNLKDFSENFITGDFDINKYVKGNVIQPFNQKRNASFFNTYSIAKSIVKNEISKAISRNRNGDGLPNASLYNLIGDDKTSFAKIFKQPASDAVRKNLFGINNINFSIIEDTIYRSDIETINGDVKNVKNFNASEIATQGIFSDFLLGLAHDGKVMLEPTVFADKVGQAMKLFNLNKPINYNGLTSENKQVQFKGSIIDLFKNGKLRDLHFYTMRSQYSALHDKLMKDYRDIFEYVINNNTEPIKLEGLENKLKTDENGKVSLEKFTFTDFGKLMSQNIIKLEKYSTLTGRRIEIQQEVHYVKGDVNGLILKNIKQYEIGEFKNSNWDPNYKKTGQTYYQRRMHREDKKFLRAMQDLNVTMECINGFGKITPDFEMLVDFYISDLHNFAMDFEEVSEDAKQNAKKEFINKWVKEDGTLRLFTGSLTEEDVYNPEVNPEINPLIELFHQSHQVLTQNYNLAVVGSPHAHKMKASKKKELEPFTKGNPKFKNNKQNFITKYMTPDEIWEEIEESARTIAMHKRMVAYQAKLHLFTQNLIEGVPFHMKMAVVKDVQKNVWNTIGDYTYFDVADGSGWVPMVAALKFRDSLGDMGADTVTFKAIRHDLDTDTVAAHLDKYAIQAISNERMRKSEGSTMPLSYMNQRAMTTINFSEVMPERKINLLDVKNHIKGNLSANPVEINDYTDVDLMKNLSMPEFLGGNRILSDIPGANMYVKTEGMGYNSVLDEYIIVKKFKNYDGTVGFPLEPGYQVIDKEAGLYYKIQPINNIYDLWQNVLGGMYSISESEHEAEFKIGNINYKYSDASHEYLNLFMDNIAIKKDADFVSQLRDMGIKTSDPNGTNFEDQDNYYQPLKEALIWQINNQSGMKNGAKNVNDSSYITSDPNVKSHKFNYFITTSSNYGVQGNFDHIYDEEHEARVTEATQMISAAASNGYLRQEVDKLYRALATVVKNSLNEEYKALVKGDDSVILMLTKTLLKTLETKERLGLAQAYGIKVQKELDKLIAKNPNLSDMKDAKYKLPLSDPNFYSAMVSMISGALNSTSIKRDLSGLGAVLSQCYNSITIVETPDGIVTTPDKVLSNKIRELMITYASELSQGNVDNFNIAFNDFKQKLRERSNEDDYVITPLSNINAFDTIMANGLVYELNSGQSYYDLKNKGILPDKTMVQGDVKILKHGQRNLKSRYYEFTVIQNGTPTGQIFNEMDLLGSKLAWAYTTAANDNFEVDINTLPNAELFIEFLNKNELTYEDLKLKNNRQLKKIKNAIIQQQQDELRDLDQKGVFAFDYQNNYEGAFVVHPGEVILPMVNKHRFGIKDGMTISNVDVEFFKKEFSKIVHPNLDFSDFYLTVKNGQHINFLNEDNWSNATKASLVKVEDRQLKSKNGRKYLTNSNGEIILEVTSNLEVYSTNTGNNDLSAGTILIKYKNIEDVKKASDSSHFINVGYNFNASSNKLIEEFINKYDKKSRKYLDKNRKVTKNTAKLYDGDKVSRLNRHANEIMASWEEQLKLMGTRIPAQALQSFMAMKIVGFTDNGLNTAYVPIKKNYLDGSDFDIDKIYMTGRSVSNNGKYNAWSPHFNYADTETSNKLPFPDAKLHISKLTDESVNITNDEFNAIEQYANLYYQGLDDSEEALTLWPSVVNSLNKLAENEYYVVDGKETTDETLASEFILDYFKDEIKDENTLLEASKNAVSSGLYRISNSVVNSMASDRGVDMDDPQAGAKKSPKTWASKQFSGDNYATLPLMKEENGAGKSVIGIAAVGTKVFYALTQFYNQKIQDIVDKYNLTEEAYGEQLNAYRQAVIHAKEIKSIPPLISEFFGGEVDAAFAEFRKLMNPKEFNFYNEATGQNKKIFTTFLANVNFENNPFLEAMNAEEITRLSQEHPDAEIIDATEVGDTSLVLSALLSSATDNAKELILAKINAGPELAGTYVYMIIQGIDFDDITNFMVSPTVDAIVLKSKSNIFNNKKSNIKDAVNYYLEGVDHKKYFNKKQKDTISSYLNKNVGNRSTAIDLNIDQKIKEYNEFIDSGIEVEKYEFLIKSAEAIKSKGINNTKTKDVLLHLLSGETQLQFIDLEEKERKNKISFSSLRTVMQFISDDTELDVFDVLQLIIPSKNGKFHATVPNNDDFASQDPYFEEENSYINKPLYSFYYELISRKNIMGNSGFNKSKAAEFYKIYEESDELTNFGARLGINGGMSTDLYGQYSYNYKTSNYFYSKLETLVKESEENTKILDNILSFYTFNDNKDILNKSFRDKLLFLTDMENLNKPVYNGSPDDLENRKKYREEVAKLYDSVKAKFNTIEAEFTLPHFEAMIGVHATAIDMFDSNTKYNYTRKLMKKLQDDGFIPTNNQGNYSKYNEQQIKQIGNFITSDLINMFFDASKMTYLIPAEVSYYDDNFNLVKSDSTVEMRLDSRAGRASFKLFMEEYLLPMWKKSGKFTGNKFIENLMYDVNRDPITGESYNYMKLDLDMLNIKSDSDQIAFQEYLNGYADLKNHIEGNQKVSDLFVIYNLLIHNNSFGKDNFTKIFEADASSTEDTLINNYMQFIGNVDASITNTNGSDYSIESIQLDKLALTLAPVVNEADLFMDKGKYVKVFNRENQSYDIYTRDVDGDGQVSYSPNESLKLIPNVPTKLYMSDVTINPLSKNDSAKYYRFKKFADEYKNGNINILINCD